MSVRFAVGGKSKTLYLRLNHRPIGTFQFRLEKNFLSPAHSPFFSSLLFSLLALPCSPSSLSSHFLSFLISRRVSSQRKLLPSRERREEESLPLSPLSLLLWLSLPSSSFCSLSLFLCECLSLATEKNSVARRIGRRCAYLSSPFRLRDPSRDGNNFCRERSSPLSLSFLLSLSLSLSFSLSPAVFLSLLGSPHHGNGFRREKNSSLLIALPFCSLLLSPSISLPFLPLSRLPLSPHLFFAIEREETRGKRGEERGEIMISFCRFCDISRS